MAIINTTAQNTALDAWLGAGKAAGMPASFECALFHGDPTLSGVELDTATGGYARVTFTNDGTSFAGATDGQSSVGVTFADSTDAWSDTATHWAWFDAADHATGWFTGTLDVELNVSAAGPIDPVTCTVFFGSAGS